MPYSLFLSYGDTRWLRERGEKGGSFQSDLTRHDLSGAAFCGIEKNRYLCFLRNGDETLAHDKHWGTQKKKTLGEQQIS